MKGRVRCTCRKVLQFVVVKSVVNTSSKTVFKGCTCQKVLQFAVVTLVVKLGVKLVVQQYEQARALRPSQGAPMFLALFQCKFLLYKYKYWRIYPAVITALFLASLLEMLFVCTKVQILTQILLIPRSHLSLVPRVASRNAARTNGRDYCNVQARAAHRASERWNIPQYGPHAAGTCMKQAYTDVYTDMSTPQYGHRCIYWYEYIHRRYVYYSR